MSTLLVLDTAVFLDATGFEFYNFKVQLVLGAIISCCRKFVVIELVMFSSIISFRS